jgi:hypothetical protein
MPIELCLPSLLHSSNQIGPGSDRDRHGQRGVCELGVVVGVRVSLGASSVDDRIIRLIRRRRQRVNGCSP